MQCIRGNREHSPDSYTPTLRSSSVSMESLIKYLEQSVNRKSFLRRSFDVVRKSFVRSNRSFSRKGSKTVKKRSQSVHHPHRNDSNNNRHSAPTIFTTSTPNKCPNHTHGEDILIFSTDCDISASIRRNQPKRRNERRWVSNDNSTLEIQCDEHAIFRVTQLRSLVWCMYVWKESFWCKEYKQVGESEL